MKCFAVIAEMRRPMDRDLVRSPWGFPNYPGSDMTSPQWNRQWASKAAARWRHKHNGWEVRA